MFCQPLMPLLIQTFVNRLFIVEPVAVNTVGLSCFNSCDPCVIQQVDITFQVDMTNEVVFRLRWNSSRGEVLAACGLQQLQCLMSIMMVFRMSLSVLMKIHRLWNTGLLMGLVFLVLRNVSGQPCEEDFGNRGITTASSNQTLPAVCFRFMCSMFGDHRNRMY